MEPRKIFNLAVDAESAEASETIFDVEPWSETILLGSPDRLSVLMLQLGPLS